MFPKGINLLPHEIAHYKTLESIAGECTLFLKRDNNAFPINKPCKVALFGSGARHTLKGGTGSGDVNSHFFNNIETELELNGFTVTTKKWLDAYDKVKKNKHISFIKRVKEDAKRLGIGAPAYSVGQIDKEIEYDIPIEEYKADICIYVLSRVSGESADRKLEKGDVLLTDTEIDDILYLNNKFDKFMLVLNVSGVVDLSPVQKVKNIFLLSQLGVVTSSILVKVILGEINPSGKLSDSWAKVTDYPYINEFGDINETRYLEGIYVGYRYFNSKGIVPLFPFGYGLSYSQFSHEFLKYEIVGNKLVLKVKVNNESNYPGKDVIQIYVITDGRINTPRNTLIYFAKTDTIKAHSSIELTLKIRLSVLTIFDDVNNTYLIQKGIYLIRGGSNSVDLTNILKIYVKDDIILKNVEPVLPAPDFKDLDIGYREDIEIINVPVIELQSTKFYHQKASYERKFDLTVPEYIKKLSLDDLILLNIGDYKTGLAGVIGQSGSLVPGAAGETTLRLKDLNHALVMADGPAGLRLISEYKINHKGTYNLVEDSIWKGVKEFVLGIVRRLFDVKKNHKKKGNIVYQYCTAIPIATAIAQSFNSDLAIKIGRLVAEEMKIYDVDIWLAPAMNIHRNILCGRNFEYYSEDPLLSGVIATSVVKGVQASGKLACIKHFVCNNQETNRFNSNSIVSERAFREIYLRGFDLALIDASPACIMTSYNLVNGIHVSENLNLLVKIIRNEWDYNGLIMSDWIITGQINNKKSKYPSIRASKCLANGVNICMPGSKKDIKDIKKAYKKGEITREALERNATKVFSMIMGNKNI